MAGSGVLTGRRLADYRLGPLLSEDSFGQVYEAAHASLHRALALRILSESLTFAAGFEERLRRVGRVLAVLDHPNLLTLDDYGKDGPYAYLVTPQVEATSLEGWLRERPREPVSPAQVMRIIGQLTSVLAALHKTGVTHLGLTPGRMLLEPNGHLLLAGTGLPYLAEELLRGWNERRAFGDPVFLAPEQLDGSAPSGVACDVYAVGVLLYRLLSGALPFDAGARNMLEAKRKPPPSLRGKHQAPPPALEHLTLRALHPVPEQRWQSISEFAEAFYAVMQAAGYERSAGAAPGSAYRALSQQDSGAGHIQRPRRGGAAPGQTGLTAPYMPSIAGETPRAWSIVGAQPGGAPAQAPTAPASVGRSLKTRAAFVLFTTLKVLLVPLVLGLLGFAVLLGYIRWQQIQAPPAPTPTPRASPGHTGQAPLWHAGAAGAVSGARVVAPKNWEASA